MGAALAHVRAAVGHGPPAAARPAAGGEPLEELASRLAAAAAPLGGSAACGADLVPVLRVLLCDLPAGGRNVVLLLLLLLRRQAVQARHDPTLPGHLGADKGRVVPC